MTVFLVVAGVVLLIFVLFGAGACRAAGLSDGEAEKRDRKDGRRG